MGKKYAVPQTKWWNNITRIIWISILLNATKCGTNIHTGYASRAACAEYTNQPVYVSDSTTMFSNQDAKRLQQCGNVHTPHRESRKSTGSNDLLSGKHDKSTSNTSFFFRSNGSESTRERTMGICTPTETIKENRVINLSSLILNKDQIILLNKGLSFTPTPPFNKFEWVKDIHLFARKLALHKFFRKENNENEQQIKNDKRIMEMLEGLVPPLTKIKPKSKMTPLFSQFKHIDIFVSMVTEKIKDIKIHGERTANNVSINERKALEALKENDQITIKSSDKGGNIVIQDKTEYKEMVLKLLKDKETYEIIPQDPTKKYREELDVILKNGKVQNLISDDEYKAMSNPYPTIPTFYAIPKIHKKTKPIPGRPIVAGNDSLTQGISGYINETPFVVSLPSYIRDTKDGVTKMRGITI